MLLACYGRKGVKMLASDFPFFSPFLLARLFGEAFCPLRLFVSC